MKPIEDKHAARLQAWNVSSGSPARSRRADRPKHVAETAKQPRRRLGSRNQVTVKYSNILILVTLRMLCMNTQQSFRSKSVMNKDWKDVTDYDRTHLTRGLVHVTLDAALTSRGSQAKSKVTLTYLVCFRSFGR